MAPRKRVHLPSICEYKVFKCEEDSYLFNSKLDCYQETDFNPKLIRTGHLNRNFSHGPEVKNHERFKQKELPKLTRIGHLNRHEEDKDKDKGHEERLKQEKLPLLSENIQVNKDVCEEDQLKLGCSWRWRMQKRRVTMSRAKNGRRPQSRRKGFQASVKVPSPLYLLKKMGDVYVRAMTSLGSRCSPSWFRMS